MLDCMLVICNCIALRGRHADTLTLQVYDNLETAVSCMCLKISSGMSH